MNDKTQHATVDDCTFSIVNNYIPYTCILYIVLIRETFVSNFEERNRRLTKIFRGIHINYTRAFISWGIINTTYESLKKLLRNYSNL